MLLTLFMDAQRKNRRASARVNAAAKATKAEIPVTEPTVVSKTHAAISRVVDFMDIPMAIIGVAYVIVYAIVVLYPNPVALAIDYVFWGFSRSMSCYVSSSPIRCRSSCSTTGSKFLRFSFRNSALPARFDR